MEYSTRYIIANFYLYVLILFIPITAIHERIHRLAYIVFGGKVKYGFKGVYAYTMEISEKPIERTKFLIVLLMPVTVISLLSLMFPNWLGGMIYFLNLLGSTGDLYMAISLIKFDSESSIIDRQYGFDIFMQSIGMPTNVQS